MNQKSERFGDSFYEAIEDDMWSALGFGCGGYYSTIDWQIIAIIESLCKGEEHIDVMAKRLGMAPSHAELIFYILASSNILEYGVSPRAGWIDHEIDKDRLVKALHTYYKKTWDEYI